MKPIKLPETIRVTDLRVRINHGPTDNDAEDYSDQLIVPANPNRLSGHGIAYHEESVFVHKYLSAC